MAVGSEWRWVAPDGREGRWRWCRAEAMRRGICAYHGWSRFHHGLLGDLSEYGCAIMFQDASQAGWRIEERAR